MNKGKFLTSINESILLLTKFKLFKSKGPKGNGIYSDEFIEISRNNDLSEMYECAIRNFDYDILLYDDSIIQFQLDYEELRYAYIQNPHKFVSKEDYLSIIYTNDELEDMLSIFSVQDLINEKEYEYEQFLTEQKLNSKSNYFRYDCAPAGYQPLVHSFSHIHIGLNENVRIPTSKILTPLKFTKFCIKNTYYDYWKSYFNSNPEFVKEIIKIKSECIKLPADKWNAIEDNELNLS